MTMILRALLVCALVGNSLVNAAWLTPFFKAGPRSDVTISRYGDPTSISMDEEIEPPIIVAVVTNYDGSEKPKFGNFDPGDNFDLGLDFELNEDNEWNMVVKNKQDYERESMQRYLFYVGIEGNQVMVQITINNIFDNAPVVTSESNPCSIPELTEPGYESTCIYNVFDADGMTNNRISFNIEGNSNEDKLFEFREMNRINQYNLNVTLFLREILYYDQRQLYNFRTTVSDIGGNANRFTTIIEVEDMPNKEPMWVKAFASARFPEKTDQRFEVSAIDGDTGINTTICYRLDFEAGNDYFIDFISIDEATGIIDVKAINRDAMKIEFYPFEIFAMKCNNLSSLISGPAALIVDDINDNLPEIYFSPEKEVILIYEQMFATLFNPSEFYVEDIDLGEHASYEIVLSQSDDAAAIFSEAFNIVPSNGYQKQTFTISVANTDLIDYENEEWQEIDILIKATEISFRENQTTKVFQVKLINWNDELPMFETDDYNFPVLETVESDYLIGTVKATDRDINDRLEYFISGRINESISVDINTGELRTLIDTAFDYDRQTEIFIQVQARDTLQTTYMNERLHTTFTQVTIQVNDVNNKPPQLRMPREILSIRENVRDQEITRNIEAFDPDTTAQLKFRIDWSDSYATKPGIVVDPKFYEGCFIIEELVVDRNNVFGILSANSSFEYNINYEEFEVLYLSITVEDTDQTIMPNTASAFLVVHIEDENDNPPKFVDNTLTVPRRVIEEAETDVLVGNIIAIDIDGPENNIIQYSLIPIGNTPQNWMTIEEDTGVLKVLANNEIGCDVPKRADLKYFIRLYDGANETFGEISIDITDINNKVPEIGEFLMEINLFEDAKSGTKISQVVVTDLDRDEPHNVTQFYINYRIYPNLQRYFAVDELTGLVTVELFGSYELDRDHGEPEHFIHVNFEDNFQGNGARNGNQTSIHLILLDVNDNAPQMPSKEDYEINENALENSLLDERFVAEDIDDPETPNAEVLYEITSIEPVEVDNEDPTGYDDLFIITSFEYKYAEIRTGKSLRGFSGRWKIEIRAYDRGDKWTTEISLSSTATYFVNVNPYNFNAPRIIFPRVDALLRIDFDSIVIGRRLTLINDQPLDPFEAIDDDAGIYGDVTFQLASTSDDHINFELVKLNRKQSELRVTRDIEERTYIFNVLAFDGGNANDRVNNVRISFVNKTGEPFFSPQTWTTNFTENVEGREEFRIIPEASDPKNVDVVNEEDKYKIYYFIDESYQPEHSQFFVLDKETRRLSLIKDLDREEVDRHEIRIISTNSESYPTRSTSDNSHLMIVITVNDVNDNPPTFQYKNYAVGVSEDDNRDKTLLTLFATDPDLDDVVTYFLLAETMVATGENLNGVRDSAFIVNERTGELKLNFDFQSNMKGFFEFQVQARDLVNHTDEASVKIYLVAEANRVPFTFLNDIETLQAADSERLVEIFSDAYEATCVIDDIRKTTINGVVQDDLTVLRVHFVLNDEALEAKQIIDKSTESVAFLTRLNSELMKMSLYLQTIPSETVERADSGRSRFLEILLIILSSVLAVLLASLALLYFMKAQSYNRQIKALTDSAFGSNSSIINSNIQQLPNTNKFANEHSNPVLTFNHSRASKVDTQSILSSDDSDDFSGLYDSPLFNVINNNDQGSSRNPLGQNLEHEGSSSSYI